jgi:hypothetical protein
MPVWYPDPHPIDGWMTEVPIRSASLPANLWVHWSGICKDWEGFPQGTQNGDWHSAGGILTGAVAAGDTVVAGQASLSLAGAHREEQGLFDTDDWGMALDSVGRLAVPIVGPASAVFGIALRTRGLCWPVAVAATIDLLVLREALIPATPTPYGQRPPPRRIVGRDKLVLHDAYTRELEGLSDRTKVLKQLLKELDDEPAVAAPPTGLPRRATMSLAMSLTSPLVPTCAPPKPPKEKPKAGRPKRSGD